VNLSIRQWFRRSGLFLLLMPVAAILLYVISCGPAAAWVADTVSGQPASSLNPVLYDSRLHWYLTFYGPLSIFRIWLRFHVSGEAEAIFQHYENLFCRPCRLADGRVVFTMIAPEQSKLSPDELESWFRTEAEAASIKLHHNSHIYSLPQTARVLVVLAQENTDARYTFDGGLDDSPVGFATLQLPP
jgi:hypothetical protein